MSVQINKGSHNFNLEQINQLTKPVCYSGKDLILETERHALVVSERFLYNKQRKFGDKGSLQSKKPFLMFFFLTQIYCLSYTRIYMRKSLKNVKKCLQNKVHCSKSFVVVPQNVVMTFSTVLLFEGRLSCVFVF